MGKPRQSRFQGYTCLIFTPSNEEPIVGTIREVVKELDQYMYEVELENGEFYYISVDVVSEILRKSPQDKGKILKIC